MRLFQTLKETVKWKKLALMYFGTLGWVFAAGMVGVESTAVIFGVSGLTLFFIFVIARIFSKNILGHSEGFPGIWITRIVSEDQIDYDGPQGMMRRAWCKNNLNGKWIHCRHGYFAFKRIDDAMAYKLRWL